MELEGQVAIVTGAGRGIGRATALELARLGADIVVAELDRANAERTAAEVQALDVRFISSLPVMQRSAYKVWADTRPVQIVWAVR
jgi:NAD(P)-dependent dehydrogenase (short-subunit alcohol dehydrogenase family)